jgi:hypothetical protein
MGAFTRYDSSEISPKALPDTLLSKILTFFDFYWQSLKKFMTSRTRLGKFEEKNLCECAPIWHSTPVTLTPLKGISPLLSYKN